MDDTRYATEADFAAAMGSGMAVLGLTPARQRKLAARALVPDATAAVVVDKKGQPPRLLAEVVRRDEPQ